MTRTSHLAKLAIMRILLVIAALAIFVLSGCYAAATIPTEQADRMTISGR